MAFLNTTLLELKPNRKTKTIKRQYKKWFSYHLYRDMELLIFGHGGVPVILFPTRMAKFYDYEDWGVIGAIREKILSGKVQVYCIDSIDQESFYCKYIPPAERIKRHAQFEKYLLDELIPFIRRQNKNPGLVSAGCSLGAYHAVNLAFRHPRLFTKVMGMSGRYDLTIQLPFFDDLLEGYWNEDIYFNMPGQYVTNLSDNEQIRALKNLDIIFTMGIEDAFLESNVRFSNTLKQKNIHNTLHLQEGEAHKARYWGELMRVYL